MCEPRFITEESNPGIKVLKIIGMVILGVIGAAAFALLFGYFVMLLWNWLMPEIFNNVATISFWQAVGIVFLARLIFGGFKHGHGHDRPPRPSRTDRRHWAQQKKAVKEKFDKWKYYDQYWKEKGEKDFDEYLREKNGENSDA
jgi:hypothetical protein